MTTVRRRLWISVAVAVVALVAVSVVAIRLAAPLRAPMRTAATWAWKLNYLVFPADDAAKLESIHTNTSRGALARCAACHEDKRDSRLVLHRIHLRSELLASLECHDCHRKVNLTKRDNKAVVTWVDVGFCKKCHSAFPGLEPGSAMKPEYFERDCTTCHKGRKAPRHAEPYLSNSIPSSECKGCHGGRVLPSTTLHESTTWLAVHGEEALEQGADSCYECHDFGLKFCEECHGKKPPSHIPADEWLDNHAGAARTDTRVCYACHKVSSCKRCHLNHEEGWAQRHPSFVQEKGDDSCAECHSMSSCTYCHMQVTAESESQS